MRNHTFSKACLQRLKKYFGPETCLKKNAVENFRFEQLPNPMDVGDTVDWQLDPAITSHRPTVLLSFSRL